MAKEKPLGDPMKCGACGGAEVELFTTGTRGDRHKFTSITARCVQCKSTTVFGVPAPVIVAEWGDGAKGVMCIGWRE